MVLCGPEGVSQYIRALGRRGISEGQAGCGKTMQARQHFTGPYAWGKRRIPRRVLKKAVQQGRSKRRGEAYASVR